MFKSIFTKITVIFSLILLMSFLVLTSILTSLVNTYNTDVKMNAMADAAYSVSVYLHEDYSGSGMTNFDDYLYTRGSSVMPVIDLLSVNVDNLVLWIVDSEGQIVFSGGSGEDLDAVIAEQEELIDAIRAELAKKVLASEEVSYYDGEYAITPKADEEQILPTQGKMMTENIVIRAIPYSVIANDSGMTAVIGG